MFLAKWIMSPKDYIMATEGTPEGEHTLVWSLYNDHKGDRPWQYRVEEIKNEIVIWIRSKIKFEKEPTFGNFIYKEVGIPSSEWYQVKVTLNPIVEKKQNNRNSIRVPLFKTEDVDNFVKRVFERNGIQIVKFNSSKPMRTISNKKITFCKSDIVGVAKVLDHEKLINAIQNGMGKERSYGCGMLCVIPISEPEFEIEE